MNSGYLNIEGLALLINLKLLGTFKFSFNPISIVGVKHKESMLKQGYQYQCYKNIVKPAMAVYLKDPSLVVKDIVAFLPAPFIMPYDMIAPYLDKISSCLSSVIF